MPRHRAKRRERCCDKARTLVLCEPWCSPARTADHARADPSRTGSGQARTRTQPECASSALGKMRKGNAVVRAHSVGVIVPYRGKGKRYPTRVFSRIHETVGYRCEDSSAAALESAQVHTQTSRLRLPLANCGQSTEGSGEQQEAHLCWCARLAQGRSTGGENAHALTQTHERLRHPQETAGPTHAKAESTEGSSKHAPLFVHSLLAPML